jgi:hypothetical protein
MYSSTGLGARKENANMSANGKVIQGRATIGSEYRTVSWPMLGRVPALTFRLLVTAIVLLVGMTVGV